MQMDWAKRPHMPSIIVKDSMIHGQGVFAARDILPGEVIIDWDECSEILTEHDIEKLSPAERKRVSFIDGQHICCHSRPDQFRHPHIWSRIERD
jgi:SET domain-containing protein